MSDYYKKKYLKYKSKYLALKQSGGWSTDITEREIICNQFLFGEKGGSVITLDDIKPGMEGIYQIQRYLDKYRERNQINSNDYFYLPTEFNKFLRIDFKNLENRLSGLSEENIKRIKSKIIKLYVELQCKAKRLYSYINYHFLYSLTTLNEDQLDLLRELFYFHYNMDKKYNILKLSEFLIFLVKYVKPENLKLYKSYYQKYFHLDLKGPSSKSTKAKLPPFINVDKMNNKIGGSMFFNDTPEEEKYKEAHLYIVLNMALYWFDEEELKYFFELYDKGMYGIYLPPRTIFEIVLSSRDKNSDISLLLKSLKTQKNEEEYFAKNIIPNIFIDKKFPIRTLSYYIERTMVALYDDQQMNKTLKPNKVLPPQWFEKGFPRLYSYGFINFK